VLRVTRPPGASRTGELLSIDRCCGRGAGGPRGVGWGAGLGPGVRGSAITALQRPGALRFPCISRVSQHTPGAWARLGPRPAETSAGRAHRSSWLLPRPPSGEGRVRLPVRGPNADQPLPAEVGADVGQIDPARLKRCERPACDLVFYDATRSGTQRWHADSPCGNRERQRRLRERSAPALAADDAPIVSGVYLS
jgi:hypothetical protein